MSNKLTLTSTAVAKITVERVPDHYRIDFRFLTDLLQADINCLVMTVTGYGGGRANINFCVAPNEQDKVVEFARNYQHFRSAKVSASDDRVMIRLGCSNITGRLSGPAGRIYRALSRHIIYIDMISTTLNAIYVIIPAVSSDKALRVLAEEFDMIVPA